MSSIIVRPLLKGLSVLLPIALSAYVLYFTIVGTERTLKQVLTEFISPHVYVPGMGIALLVAVVWVVGLLMYPWLSRKVIAGGRRLLSKIPLVGSLYSSLDDMVGVFDGRFTDKLGKPVLVSFPHIPYKAMGFLMSEDGVQGLPSSVVPDGHVLVYMQMSYQLGGVASSCRASTLKSWTWMWTRASSGC